jgi:endoglucanase
VSHDVLGSAIARVKGTGDGPLLAVMGHIDEIGLVVSHIDEKGFLRFRNIGGWDPVVLVGQRLKVLTREGAIDGVIARRPIHFFKNEQQKSAPELKDLQIDIGAKDADDARARVRIGDVAVIAAEPLELPGGRLVSRALDNRLGCYVAYEVARRIAEAGGVAGDVAAVVAVQEETTFAGSFTTTFALDPAVAVAIDVMFETDQADLELGELTSHPFGSGPVLTRGSTIHPGVFELLHDTAEAEGIPFTVESAGRETLTDADAIQLVRAGVATALVSIPCRYVHSPVEMAQLDDVENTVRLLVAFARRLEAGMSFLR